MVNQSFKSLTRQRIVTHNPLGLDNHHSSVFKFYVALKIFLTLVKGTVFRAKARRVQSSNKQILLFRDLYRFETFHLIYVYIFTAV